MVQRLREQVVSYFQVLKRILANTNHDTYWRIHPELADSLDVESSFNTKLLFDIERSSIALCMPSTVLLECMALKRPTCLLNIYNTPNYIGTAWQLNSPESILSVTINDMINPPIEKIKFQDVELREHLQVD